MAEKTGIAWCDSTFNPWIGCTKVGPGCDHCYAADQDARRRWDGGKVHWGVGVPRYHTSAANWELPRRWNKKAAASGEVHRVFCSSLADVFDNEVPDEWRKDLFDLIEQTPHLEWLLLTKRIGNVPAMAYRWLLKEWPANVRLMITVVNQEEADRDIPKLLVLPCKNGVSYEPALGPVNWAPWMWPVHPQWPSRFKSPDDALAAGAKVTYHRQGLVSAYASFLQWVIIGGESGSHARPFSIDWARATVDQCLKAGTPPFVKQLGAAPYLSRDAAGVFVPDYEFHLKDRAGADPAEWPEDLRVQEFPV